jgi:hypothetical protein
MNMHQNLIQTVKVIVLALIIGTAAQIVSAENPWKGAPGIPPAANVDAPVNVGSLHQVKTGSLKSNVYLTAPDGIFINTTVSGKYLLSNRGNDWWSMWRTGADLGDGQKSYFAIRNEKKGRNDVLVDEDTGKTFVSDVCLQDRTKCLSGTVLSEPNGGTTGVSSVTATVPLYVTTGAGNVNVSWSPKNVTAMCIGPYDCWYGHDLNNTNPIGGNTSGVNTYGCPAGYYLSRVYTNAGGNNQVLAVGCYSFY